MKDDKTREDIERLYGNFLVYYGLRAVGAIAGESLVYAFFDNQITETARTISAHPLHSKGKMLEYLKKKRTEFDFAPPRDCGSCRYNSLNLVTLLTETKIWFDENFQNKLRRERHPAVGSLQQVLESQKSNTPKRLFKKGMEMIRDYAEAIRELRGFTEAIKGEFEVYRVPIEMGLLAASGYARIEINPLYPPDLPPMQKNFCLREEDNHFESGGVLCPRYVKREGRGPLSEMRAKINVGREFIDDLIKELETGSETKL